MEAHNTHYADKSIIHEHYSSQNSKNLLFDPCINTVFLLSSSSSLSSLLSYTEWALCSTAEELQPQQCPGTREYDASFIREVSSHTGDVD
ncbi:hypothetical protein PBY51_017385 [Eleginops maclovinus]|uniref:Uncharacterized protein n=1 Tax=Eleginops maclovinus TaxID=56733 RepID=A0AAN7XKC8_ELEMC|nr:hypothetical protein PBY51_017385 [Eleginops maclovinus]